jgi:tyrosinase
MLVRKNYRRLTNGERALFVAALYYLKEDGIVDRFADIHRDHFNHSIHRTSHFLPWHREMLFRFERELQSVFPHINITIPYWDSTVDRSPSDPLWSDRFLGQFNSDWDLKREFDSAVTLRRPEDVEENHWRETYFRFSDYLEDHSPTSIHNGPHNWVGGVMRTFASPGDPAFYLHHCWIDMLWALWQYAHPGAPFKAYVLQPLDPNVPPVPLADVALNAPLEEFNEHTPADVLDHHALGYRYDTEPPSNIYGALSLLLEQEDIPGVRSLLLEQEDIPGARSLLLEQEVHP